MPDAIQELVRAKKPTAPKRGDPCQARARQSQNARRILFFLADLVFLVLAGVASTLAMHLIHELEWPFVLTCAIGMIAAMVVQTLMAFAAAPLLGSIESMVPSMIVGMARPMTICVLHVFGCESTWQMGIPIGIAFAIGMFVFIQLYGRSCRRVLARQVPLLRG